MPPKSDKAEKLTAQLISKLSGFQPGDENYGLCYDYASSNIKYHKFLDPDSCKIKKSIDGLVTKFRVHCQDEKARLFQGYVDQFLDLPAFEYREGGKTNTHWAVLSLLLNISDSPVNSEYVPSEKVTKEQEEEKFDWYAYLMEGEEQYIPSLDDSSDEDFELEGQDYPKHNVTFAPDVSTDVVKDESTLMTTHIKTANEIWLERNVVVEYWKHGQTLHPSDHDSSRFNLQWEDQLTRSVDIYVGEDCVPMSEYQVVREAIWMLLGAEQSYLFVNENDQWKVRPNIQLSHITHSALASSLQDVLKYSAIVRRVQHFLESTSQTGEQVPQTYQAFRGALWEVHIQFQQYMAQVEKSILKQEQIATITSLMNTILPRVRDFDVIDHILRHGIDTCRDVRDNAVKACTLLAAMFNLLTSCHVLSDESTQINLVLSLWVQSCKPYLDKIDQWLYEGVLHDPGQEFIIKINEEIDEESFWDKGFTLHCTAPPNTDNAEEDEQFAPVFLIPVLHQLIMAGKSMHLLFKLGKVKHVYPGANRQSLYEAFISSIEEYLGTPAQDLDAENANDSTTAVKLSTTNSDTSHLFSEHIEQQLHLKQDLDPLLRLNFCNILKKASSPDGRSSELNEEERLSKTLTEVQLNPLTPIQLMLRHCLYSHIAHRYETVCSSLLAVLKEDFKLFSYFHAVKRYYLMEAGDTMYDFCTELFEKLRHREEWKDISYLNTIMQDCLHARFPQDEDRLFVSVDEDEAPSRDRIPIKALDSLSLDFKMPWPVSAVLNTKCMNIYNSVFRFLLMIKRAKYDLDELRFAELEKTLDYDVALDSAADTTMDSSTLEPPRETLIHNMHLLKFKLLCFTNSLHNYIMTKIVHSSSLQFEANLEKARDLDDVIKAHNHYVITLHERCFQHEESKFTKEILTRILDLAVKFSILWNQGIDQIKFKTVHDIESDFSKWLHFLSTFFKKVIQRGSFAHLEPLAFALDPSYGQKPTAKT